MLKWRYQYILAWVLMLPVAAYTQVLWPERNGQWEDSLTIRTHLTVSLANEFYDYADAPGIWDASRHAYTSLFLFRCTYSALKATNYRRVTFKKIKIGVYPSVPGFISENNPDRMARLLDSFTAHVPALETGFLEYDKFGYLLAKYTDQVNTDGAYTIRDTVAYNYVWRDGAISNISVNRSGHEQYDKPNYASVYCGTINKGKLDIKTHQQFDYVFNATGLLTSAETDYSSFANDCWNNEPERRIITLKYDQRGRALEVVDSTVNKQITNAVFQYSYGELPISVILGDAITYAKLYPALMLPQVSKWLRGKEGAVVSFRRAHSVFNNSIRYDPFTRKNVATGEMPQVREQKDVWAMDANGRVWGQFFGPDQHYNFTLYQYGADSLGQFQGKYQVFSLPQPDTATFNPKEERRFETIKSGCIVADYPIPRKGSIAAENNDLSERNVYGRLGGFRLVVFTKYYSGGMSQSRYLDEWTPLAQRANPWVFSVEELVLIRPDGLVQYIYKDNLLYSLEYE